MTALTDRFARAVDYARIAHAAQVRKGSGIPYVYHPLAVASLVIEFGGNEDQAIVAVLHDVVEDCGQAHAAIIRAQFGNAVADIVEACTDGTAEGKPRTQIPTPNAKTGCSESSLTSRISAMLRTTLCWFPLATSSITRERLSKTWKAATTRSSASPVSAMAPSPTTTHSRSCSRSVICPWQGLYVRSCGDAPVGRLRGRPLPSPNCLRLQQYSASEA